MQLSGSQGPKLGNSVFDNLAVRAAEVLRNKMVELGEVDQGKIETAQSEMVKTANALIASGDIERGG